MADKPQTTDIVTEPHGKAAFAMSGAEGKWDDLPDADKVQWRHRGFRAALDMKAQGMDPVAARARFAELTKEFEELKAERDAKDDKLTRSQMRAYDDKIRKANVGLYEIEMERAALSRALGGKTSEPG
jgi:hypothetical protein